MTRDLFLSGKCPDCGRGIHFGKCFEWRIPLGPIVEQAFMEDDMATAKTAVRAKFKVQRIERSMGSRSAKLPDGTYDHTYVEQWSIVMAPVYGNGDPNHENTKFWQATPAGEIKLTTVNADAVAQFDLNKEFYIDFTLAE